VQSLNAGETLEQVVNVTISDGEATDTATVTLTLTGENDAPTVAAGSGDGVEDGAGISVELAALGDDVDDEDTGASLAYAITTEPGAGSASIDGTSLLFVPGSDFQALNAGEETTVDIGITATDARGAQSAEQVVTITVTGENDAPTLVDLETALGSVAEDGPAAGFDFASLALADDADAEDDATTLTYAVQQVLLDGTEIDRSAASFDGSTLTVDPSSLADMLDAGETGTLAVEVLVTDAQGAEATRTYTVDVTGANDAPVIGDESAEVQEDDGAAVVAGLAALTSDVDGDDDPASNVTYAVTGVAGGGASSVDGTDLVFDTAGDFETLAAGETEEVTIDVTATDDSGASDTATITVTVTGENDAPVLENQSLDADEDGEAVSLDLAALASDVDATDTLTFALAATPARGLVTLADGVIAFDPNGDFEDLDAGETDTIVAEVTVSDGTETITRTVSFTVTGQHDASGVVRIGSSEADFLSGTDGNDRLDSGAGDDDLSGGAGADGMIGRQGNDTLDGGDGDDNIAAGEGDDFVFGGGGDDAIGGGAGSDNIDAGEGNDTIGGGFGDDTIIAGAGDDLVAGGAGKDFIAAGSGDDVVSGSFGSDTLFGGAGNDDLGGGFGMDTLSAGLGDDSVGGGNGDDLINGGAGNDFLAGGGRNDRINGGVGDDTINGGNGSDELIGGSGSDLFVFNAPDPSQTDTIFDFEVGSDQILLIGVENVPGSGLEGRLEALEMTHTMYGVGADAVESVVLSYEGQEIVIVGVAAEDLTLEDISFL
jgi:VCBS repeat-containing protein